MSDRPDSSALQAQLRERVLDALAVEGNHHKQYAIWEIAELVLSPYDIAQLRDSGQYDEGIPG